MSIISELMKLSKYGFSLVNIRLIRLIVSIIKLFVISKLAFAILRTFLTIRTIFSTSHETRIF